ncbi:hypothetical protein HV433_17675 [Bacillus sporothermodurans]|uniref:hypothetical protein n=1 Tax=Heyndrickxia sporothermodurans TaxID=46224 RepID=UPI00192CA5A0|nr:hypothetical protein [Heyndrickxia sporothermodurans]MBL5855258.1 hypothetical protein [Heyndrickxia sporothermodurans]
MKKLLMTFGVLLFVLSILLGTSSKQAFAHHNVIWGNMLVKKDQIGKVDIKKNTNIYKMKNKKLVYYKKVVFCK